jgi:hypothetical protein
MDFKSIYVPTSRDILLQRIKGSVSDKRSKGEGEKNYAGEVEEESYSLDRFLKLVSEGQTVALDVLFSNSNIIQVYNSYIWDNIERNRHRLLTKESKAFIGYCRQQSAKYGIKGSRVAAVRDSLNFLKTISLGHVNTIKLGHFEKNIEIFSNNREFVKIVDIELPNTQLIRHLEVCGRKLPYTSTIKNAIDILQKLFDEYGHRALQAENNEGVDWKALSHAVRIGQEAIELFDTHNIIFPRPNALELIAIKTGQIPYKDVAEKIEDLFVEVELAAERSTLPESVDKEWIDDFIVEVYGDEIIKEYHYKRMQ